MLDSDVPATVTPDEGVPAQPRRRRSASRPAGPPKVPAEQPTLEVPAEVPPAEAPAEVAAEVEAPKPARATRARRAFVPDNSLARVRPARRDRGGSIACRRRQLGHAQFAQGRSCRPRRRRGRAR